MSYGKELDLFLVMLGWIINQVESHSQSEDMGLRALLRLHFFAAGIIFLLSKLAIITAAAITTAARIYQS